jgi:hypothetical protein
VVRDRHFFGAHVVVGGRVDDNLILEIALGQVPEAETVPSGEAGVVLAELPVNAFDDFSEIMIFIILEVAARRCRFSLYASIASAPELNASPLLWPRALCWRCCCQSNCSTVL